MLVKIEESCRQRLQEEFDKPYFKRLVAFVKNEYAHYTVFPPGHLLFHAFNTCPFDKVKVVILGQDPWAILTVRAHQAGSHQGKGWEQFTDAVIRRLNDERENIVFMLWGSYAQKKSAFIDQTRHCVLKAPHPSPLSADRGFFGCRHFSKANAYFRSKSLPEIKW